MITIGVDPGITGAIAILSGDAAEVHDMPVALVKKGKNEVMAAELSRILDIPGEVVLWLEQVHAMPGQGVASSFGFGRSLGVVEGVAAALQIPVHFVTPQKWKKHFKLQRSDKDVSRTIASQLYPQAELHRKRDIGRADALLIARYGQDQGPTDEQ